MDHLDDIRYKMRVSKLEAKLALREIDNAALTREIRSPLISYERRTEAFQRREALQGEWSEIMEELKGLRFAQSIQLDIRSRKIVREKHSGGSKAGKFFYCSKKDFLDLLGR